MELRPCGRLDVYVYAVLMKRRWLLYCSFCLISCDTVGMLNIVEGNKKINTATLNQFFGVKYTLHTFYYTDK